MRAELRSAFFQEIPNYLHSWERKHFEVIWMHAVDVLHATWCDLSYRVSPSTLLATLVKHSQFLLSIQFASGFLIAHHLNSNRTHFRRRRKIQISNERLKVSHLRTLLQIEYLISSHLDHFKFFMMYFNLFFLIDQYRRSNSTFKYVIYFFNW